MRGTTRKNARIKSYLFLLAVAYLGVQPLPAQNPIVTELRKEWDRARTQITIVTEAMPDEKYGYRPTPNVRSFREILIHVIGANITWMEAVGGIPNPGSEERYEKLQTRAELLKALSDYLNYGTKVMDGMTDQKVLEAVPFRNGRSLRLAIILQTIGHTYRNFGHLAGC